MSATATDLDELIALRVLAQGGRLAEPRRSAAVRSGSHASRWRGRGVDFRESRIYQAGDDIRHMDWRLTARSGRAHTKVFEEEREQGLLLAVDFNPGMRFGTRKRFKSVQAGRAAALLAWLAADGGDRVGLIGFGGGIGGEVKPAGGRRGVLRVLRALRDWDAAADPGLLAPWSSVMPRIRRLLRPGMRLVVLSDGFDADPAAWSPLAQLAARHDIAAVLLRDALEMAPPPPGRYALSSGGVKQTLDFSDAHLRAEWPRHFSAARDRVRAESLRIGVRVLELDTDADLKRTLAPLLARSRVVTGIA
ncbi:DUF58 domain-containing protein [Dokdonella koreensis]|uniref:DUF58 domain-containing protein n=1 Tax=Dokdonella koreensis DS-123 TaxID=1300342 RepID=A0A160DUI6_9GAMM|nr:DUF58 domain-containing protein [Dokdonella koreensis]ANB18125.1 Hypothetical protein I596_2106 [Dokdonella koreensis DS-123]